MEHIKCRTPAYPAGVQRIFHEYNSLKPLAPQRLEAVLYGDSLDWKEYDAPTIFDRVTTSVASGSIVLFHNAALHTPEALPDIIEYLLANGYRIVPVSELLLQGDYELDHTGRMCRPGTA